MKYRLDGAKQQGYHEWKWFEGEEAIDIEPNEVLVLINSENYYLHSPFPRLRKWIMRLMGYGFYQSERTKSHVIVHDSIIERYFVMTEV